VNIVVCVKETVDTAAALSLQDGAVYWGDASLIINPWDEFAVETALRLTEEHGGKVTAVCVGGTDRNEALKHALAMGCADAVQVEISQELLTISVAALLAAAVSKMPDVDLVFFGRQSTDEESGLTPAQTARLLNWPALTHTAKILNLDTQGQTVDVERLFEEGRQVVRAAFPAVVSVVKEICEPRYPSFMGIRKASRAEIPRWSLQDLGLEVAPEAVWTRQGITAPTRQSGEVEIIDGENAADAAVRLIDRLIEEKVL
jgi:electron transfer flavoprotein beta subunit